MSSDDKSKNITPAYIKPPRTFDQVAAAIQSQHVMSNVPLRPVPDTKTKAK